jgi:hypothetical protein
MINALDNLPLASLLAVVVTIVGGVVAIVNPDVLSFEDYVKNCGIFVGGAGLLGAARAASGKGMKR